MEKPGALTVTTPTDREIVMTREFDAPRKLVFEALTKPDLLKRWLFGPDDWSLDVCEIDLKPGGAYRYVWKRPSKGTVMGMGGIFTEVVPPERIAATEKFDEAWYPGEAVATQVLTENSGRTLLTITILYESKEPRDMAVQSGMTRGMELGYARLADVLGSLADARR